MKTTIKALRLNAVLVAAKAAVNSKGLAAAQCGRALVGRIRQGKRIENQIRDCKKARRVLSQNGLSTRPACQQLAFLRTEVNKCWDIVSHLKRHYRNACQDSYIAKDTLAAIEELESMTATMDTPTTVSGDEVATTEGAA